MLKQLCICVFMYLCICKLYLPRTHAYLAAPHPVSSLELSAVCTFLTTDGVTIFIIIAITIFFNIIITTDGVTILIIIAIAIIFNIISPPMGDHLHHYRHHHHFQHHYHHRVNQNLDQQMFELTFPATEGVTIFIIIAITIIFNIIITTELIKTQVNKCSN